MKRATITLSDELEAELESYLADQEVPLSLTSLVQVALGRFLAERRRHRGWSAGGPPPSEVAEEPAMYSEPVPSWGGGAPWAWGPPAAPRVRDLPGLLAGLPRLSEAEAREMASDLDRAREELKRSGLHDPWSRPDPGDVPGPRGA